MAVANGSRQERNLMSPFKWLHLSDIHFKSKISYDATVVLRSLIKSLPDIMNRGGKPDIIIVSGDIAHSGQPEEYVIAASFLDQILEVTGCTKNQLIVVPGNHDIDRNGGSGLARTLQGRTEADTYFDNDKPKVHISNKMKNFQFWYDNYFDGIDKFSLTSTCGSIRTFNTNFGSIAILPINTAAFCIDDSDHGKICIGRRCLDKAVDELSALKADFNIGVMHHPIDWLNPIERPNILSLIQQNFDIILKGHLHDHHAGVVADASGSVLNLSAGATYQTRNYSNSATLCSFNGRNLQVLPVRYEDSPHEVWTVDTSAFPREPNFSKVFDVAGRGRAVRTGPLVATNADLIIAAGPTTNQQSLRADFERDLFVTPSGQSLYVEPNIVDRPQDAWWEGGDSTSIDLRTIVEAPDSYLIEARSEYGGTTLCRRIVLEFGLVGRTILHRDARVLPNYKKRLDQEFRDQILDGSPFTLILDNFDRERDERLLREIAEIGVQVRIIAVETNRGLAPNRNLKLSGTAQFKHVYLWPLSRKDIRFLAASIFESVDEVFISGIVDKTYDDLLALCIPLTPVNVVMYLKILSHEGEFHPLNRVEIVGRYVREVLRRSSDVYAESFSAKSKIDVISAFAYSVYEKRLESFTDKDWHDFIQSYQNRTLTEFDGAELLQEALGTRIFARFDGKLYFRYMFYFSYFMGRYIAARPAVLEQFLLGEEYLKVDNIIDVITGISSDNSVVLKALNSKLDGHLAEFAERFIPADFDPLEGAVWPDSQNEDEKLWKPIAAAIEAGPAGAKEIDVIKSSLISEARTADQQVRYREFVEIESVIFRLASILSDAVRNADDVDGDVKVRSLEGILRTHHVGMQIGALIAPALASNSIVRWGGIVYLNFNRLGASVDPQSPEAIFAVVRNLNRTVARAAAQGLGAHKLGGLFRARELRDTHVDFLTYANFCCVVASRGVRWEETVNRCIERTDKNSFYLSTMLTYMMRSLKKEILQSKDREILKRSVALIQAKRSFGRQLPGARAVKKVLEQMEIEGKFGRE